MIMIAGIAAAVVVVIIVIVVIIVVSNGKKKKAAPAHNNMQRPNTLFLNFQRQNPSKNSKSAKNILKS